MKLRYILSVLAAGLLIFTGCEEESATMFDEAQLSSSYVGIPADGGSKTITVTATDSWSITNIPSWLTISPASGSAGETIVTFSAGAAESTNEATVTLKVGSKDLSINVIQMTEAVELPISTAAEVNAGPDSKNYRVKGVVTKIANTTYGNWYLEDATGEVYIYGTLDAAGNEKNFTSLGLEVGDIVTCEGPKTTYNGTVELVNVTVVAIEKSLIKVESIDLGADEEGNPLTVMPIEGGAATVVLVNKGDGVSVVVPEEAQSWLPISTITTSGTTTKVIFNIPANSEGDREATVTFKTTKSGKEYSSQATIAQKGAIIPISIADFNALPDGSSTIYRISGIVSKVAGESEKYGMNLYLKDATGETYIYGTVDASGAAEMLSTKGVEEGDIVEFIGKKTSYKGTNQMSKGVYQYHKDVKVATAAEVNAMADEADKTNPVNYVKVTGKVTAPTADGRKFDLETYGNFDLVDESGDLYVYGVSTGWNGATKQFGTLGVKEGDIITLIGYKTSYKGTNELVAMYVSHETPADDEPGDDSGDDSGDETELGEYGSNVTLPTGTNAYNDGLATVNGVENVATLKFGTSKNPGEAKLSIPAGTKELSYYAVAWKGSTDASLTFKAEGLDKTQAVAANDGATGNSPYTITVTDSDKYTIAFEKALEAALEVTVTSAGRVIMFGVQAK